MTTQHYIFLENVRFYSYHGVAPQETAIGNEFIINLRLKTDFGKATETDEVEDTVSYADIYAALKEEMELPSKLLEHVCGRIVKRLFRDFRKIREIEIKLGKEESEASESAHENGGTVQQRHVFPACFPLMFQTFF